MLNKGLREVHGMNEWPIYLQPAEDVNDLVVPMEAE
jgi:hypothetical protein